MKLPNEDAVREHMHTGMQSVPQLRRQQEPSRPARLAIVSGARTSFDGGAADVRVCPTCVGRWRGFG